MFADASDTLSLDDIDDVIKCSVYQAMLHYYEAQTNVSTQCPYTVTTKEPNYETLHPYLGWLPYNDIKETFARTTQHVHMPMSTYLKKYF